LRSFGYGAYPKPRISKPMQIAQARAKWRGLMRYLHRRFAVPG